MSSLNELLSHLLMVLRGYWEDEEMFGFTPEDLDRLQEIKSDIEKLEIKLKIKTK